MNSLGEAHAMARWLMQAVTYDLGKSVIIAASSTAVLKKAFGLLRENRQTLLFAVTTTLLLTFLFADFESSFRPDIRASIRGIFSVSSDNVTPPPPYPGVYAFLIMSVENLGTPTAVDSYQLEVKVGSQRYRGFPVAIGEEGSANGRTPSGRHFSFTIKGSEALFQKTVTPVPTGGKITGILMFRFAGMKDSHDIEIPDARYCVHFEDVAQTWYRACQRWTGIQTEPAVVPGLDMEVRIAPESGVDR